MQVDKPKSSVASELENYLDCRDVAADPLEFWRNNRQSFPRLFEIIKQTLFARGSTAGIEQSFSVAGYTVVGHGIGGGVFKHALLPPRMIYNRLCYCMLKHNHFPLFW